MSIEETRCMDCGKVLAFNGERLESSYFDSALPKPLSPELRLKHQEQGLVWARCGPCNAAAIEAAKQAARDADKICSYAFQRGIEHCGLHNLQCGAPACLRPRAELEAQQENYAPG